MIFGVELREEKSVSEPARVSDAKPFISDKNNYNKSLLSKGTKLE